MVAGRGTGVENSCPPAASGRSVAWGVFRFPRRTISRKHPICFDHLGRSECRSIQLFILLKEEECLNEG